MKILNQNEMLQVFGGDKQAREIRRDKRKERRARRKRKREAKNTCPAYY